MLLDGSRAGIVASDNDVFVSFRIVSVDSRVAISASTVRIPACSDVSAANSTPTAGISPEAVRETHWCPSNPTSIVAVAGDTVLGRASFHGAPHINIRLLT